MARLRASPASALFGAAHYELEQRAGGGQIGGYSTLFFAFASASSATFRLRADFSEQHGASRLSRRHVPHRA